MFYIIKACQRLKQQTVNIILFFVSSLLFIGCHTPDKVTFEAWVGKDDSLITIKTPLPDSAELYSFRNKDCDISNITACEQGQNLILNGQTIIDPAFTLDNPAYYQLTNGSLKSKASLANSNGFLRRIYHQAIEFNNKLWLIGGRHYDIKNDVWSSEDGISWIQKTNKAGFSARARHQVAVFNNKLWVIGGYELSRNYKNDIWSSSDGVNWTQETANAGFSARAGHQVTVFNNKLWIIGGYDDGGRKNDIWSSIDGKNWTQESANAGFSARWGHQVTMFKNQLWLIGNNNRKNDIWSSSDGINWTQESANAGFSAHPVHQVTVFNNKLWIIGGSDDGGIKNDIWSSVDGINWTQETNKADFTPRSGHEITVFNNKLWVIGGTGQNDAWSSSDGINWTQETANADFSTRYQHQVTVFNNKLWIIGGLGGSIGPGYKNDVWSSENGINWTQETANADFSARHNHQVTVFNNKLWVIGGFIGGRGYKNDIWSSSDGINWTQETANAAFSGRYNHQVTVFNNKLWVIGGFGEFGGWYGRGYKNDIWSSSDGINWTQETANAAFLTRITHRVAVFNNKLWLIGGFKYDSGKYISKNDVWSSSDGKNWTQETANAGLSARSEHQVGVFKNQLWLIGGIDARGFVYSDVWKSTDGKNWRKGYSGAIYK